MILSGDHSTGSWHIVKNPNHAWLAPICALGNGILLPVFFTAILGIDLDESRAAGIISGGLVVLSILGWTAYGIYKTIECLRFKRDVLNGSVGAVLNISTLLMWTLVLIGSFAAAIKASTPHDPESAVQLYVEEVGALLPIPLDDLTTITDVFAAPSDTLNIKHLIRDDKTPINSMILESVEQTVRAKAELESSAIPGLLRTGASVNYIYEGTDGNVLLEFTVTPQNNRAGSGS